MSGGKLQLVVKSPHTFGEWKIFNFVLKFDLTRTPLLRLSNIRKYQLGECLALSVVLDELEVTLIFPRIVIL